MPVASNEIMVRRFDAEGNALTAEFQINTTTANGQVNPRITAFSDDSFVVVWQSFDQDGEEWGIYGQRFGADGHHSDALNLLLQI